MVFQYKHFPITSTNINSILPPPIIKSRNTFDLALGLPGTKCSKNDNNIMITWYLDNAFPIAF